MKYILILTLSLASWTNCLFAQGISQPDKWIIGFAHGTSVQERTGICSKYGLKIVEDLYPLNAVVVESVSKFRTFDFKLMETNPRVMGVQQNLYIQWLNDSPESIKNTPLPSLKTIVENLPEHEVKSAALQKDTEIPWGIARVNAPAAWYRTMGAGVKVAIIDTGIDPTHPDLKGQVAGGVSYHNGGNWADDHGHGTHVAGITAAIRNGKGVAGVAPMASLYAVKVLNKNGGGDIIKIIRGILWAAQNKMDVINMSLGTPIPLFPVHWAVMYAKFKGVTIVAAAGNNGKGVNFPAAYKEVIAVSASDFSNKIADFSSRGNQIALIAPGVAILSTIPGGYGTYSGTSMASPHAAGLAALAIGSGATGPDAVQAALTKAARPLQGLTPTEQGAGMVNAAILVTEK